MGECDLRRVKWNSRDRRSVRFGINETSDPSGKEALSQERSHHAPFCLSFALRDMTEAEVVLAEIKSLSPSLFLA